MELPDTCPKCNHENMVDFGSLEKRPISKLITVEGYSCTNCQVWKPLWYSTLQLEENIRRLKTMPPSHSSFYFHLVKAVKRAEVIQERGRLAWQEQTLEHG